MTQQSAVPVQEQSQVAEVRRIATGCARSFGFGELEAGRVAIVATEMATNLVKHAGGGMILVGGSAGDQQPGCLDLTSIDRGPGIRNVGESMRDGHSTSGSPGTGLGAVARLASEWDLYSRPDGGTIFFARLRSGATKKIGRPRTVTFGGVNVPFPGEEISGDAWSTRPVSTGSAIVVIDGLGHGPAAAEASCRGIETFMASRHEEVDLLLDEIHGALRSTRGGAGSIAIVEPEAERIRFGGIGNVAATILPLDGSRGRRLISHNGTLGLHTRSVQEIVQPFQPGDLFVIHSDGLTTQWSLDQHPGLREHHPAVIAALLYRDHCRGRDDASVVVARIEQGVR